MDKIKVGGIEYTVERKELEASEGVQFGWCRCDKALIEINDRINEQKQEQTLIHELTHAMFHECGLDGRDDEEDIVNRLSIVLHQVLKENDFSWLRDEYETIETHDGSGNVTIEKVEVTH